MKKMYGILFAVVTALVIILSGMTVFVCGVHASNSTATAKQRCNCMPCSSLSDGALTTDSEWCEGAQSTALAIPTKDVILPVVMYHSILKSRNGVYIVSPTQLEQDFIAFKKYGYSAVFPSEVIKYVHGEGDLPDKPLMITFDDGLYNNVLYALPLLQKYDLKANINIVGAYSDFYTESVDHSNPNYAHLTWEQLSETVQSGRFEIGNHSYDMHKYAPRFGVLPIKGESDELYADNLRADVALCQDKINRACGSRPVVFAYPYGKYTKASNKILKNMGYEMLLTCNEGISILKRGDIEGLQSINRINRSGMFNTDTVMAKLHGAR